MQARWWRLECTSKRAAQQRQALAHHTCMMMEPLGCQTAKNRCCIPLFSYSRLRLFFLTNTTPPDTRQRLPNVLRTQTGALFLIYRSREYTYNALNVALSINPSMKTPTLTPSLPYCWKSSQDSVVVRSSYVPFGSLHPRVPHSSNMRVM